VQGRVWLDADADGWQDQGESGIANALVRLVNSAGQVVATALTSATGHYLFVGVAPGSYTERLTPVPGLVLSTPDVAPDHVDRT